MDEEIFTAVPRGNNSKRGTAGEDERKTSWLILCLLLVTVDLEIEPAVTKKKRQSMFQESFLPAVNDSWKLDRVLSQAESRASTLSPPGLDNTRLSMSLTAGAGTCSMSLLSSSPSLDLGIKCRLEEESELMLPSRVRTEP